MYSNEALLPTPATDGLKQNACGDEDAKMDAKGNFNKNPLHPALQKELRWNTFFSVYGNLRPRHRQTCVPVPGPVPGSDVPMFVIQCTAQALVLSLFKGLELQPMSGFVSVTSQDTMHPGTRLQD